ncbi:MAG: hypothetical protein IJH39_02450 [Clostridia bacterium]|nr:hypothetical protein [Clostridia bacterium]
MILGKETSKKGNERAFRNGDLIKILKEYPEDSIILFQDFNFKSSKKQVVRDVIVRQEHYPLNKCENGKSIILINKFLNL